MTKNTFWANVIHVAAQGLAWGIPLVLLQYPELGKVTIGGVLSLLVSYLNNQYHLSA